MVAGGEDSRIKDSRTDMIEIIDLIDDKFCYTKKCPYFKNCTPIGGVLDNKVIICGAESNFNDTDYWSYLGRKLTNYLTSDQLITEMFEKRCGASGMVINNSKLWILGGTKNRGGETSIYGVTPCETTELFTLDKMRPVGGPKIPFGIRDHSMIQIDSDTAYVLGGQHGHHGGRKKTWFVDLTSNYEWKEGPALIDIEYKLSCAKMNMSGKTILVAVGSDSKYIEILDLSNIIQGWTKGMNMLYNSESDMFFQYIGFQFQVQNYLQLYLCFGLLWCHLLQEEE